MERTLLATLLERHRLDQSWLAERVGVSRVSVGHWCRGQHPIGAAYVRAVYLALQPYEPELSLEALLPQPEVRP